MEAKLVVEIDGRSHDNNEQRAYDERCTEFPSEQGWRVLRVRDTDLVEDEAGVATRVLKALAGAAPSP